MKKVLPPVLMMTLGGGVMLVGYEIFRPVSSSRFVSDFGSNRLPYVVATIPIAITIATYVYSIVLRALRPRMTFFVTLILSTIAPLLLYWASLRGLKLASAGLYLFAQIYIVLLIAQIWAWVNSTLEVAEAKKLNGWILGIASLGSTLGGYLTRDLAKNWGTIHLLPLGAGFTILALIFVALAFRWSREPEVSVKEEKMKFSDYFAFGMFREHRTVAWLAVVVAVTQVVSILLEMTFMRTVEGAMPGAEMEDIRTAFLGNFWMWVNIGAIAINLLLSPILLSRFPLLLVLIAMPLVHLGTVTWQLLSPSLAAATAAFLCFKTFDYSLFNASKELVYIPLPFEARYRAKMVVDAMIYRGTKGVTSAILSFWVAAGQALSVVIMPAVVAAFLVIWLKSARRLVPVSDV